MENHMLAINITRNGGSYMHKTNSPVPQGRITYVALPDGSVDVWIRNNEQQLPETEEGPGGYEADEIYFRLSSSDVVPKTEIEADADFWFEKLSEFEEGGLADHLSKAEYRKRIRAELSASCEQIIYAGVDVELSEGTEHFSLTQNDQINLFGKQAQLAAGSEKLEYHQDGQACKYYSSADMQKIITAAMAYVSYHTTYCNSAFTWLEACEKASDMQSVRYGETIPEQYCSEVYKDYKEMMEG